jgi:exodeoxyribonuclease VII large subunit
VIRDIMHRLNARFPRRVLLWPVAVQGEKAAAEIAAAIAGFNAMGPAFPRPDLLIVARGGGSIEDLMAFNEEVVVRAAAASKIPLISAVGHETDTTLIDFASDMRAPTPTAAAELAVPVLTDLNAALADFGRRARNCFDKGVSDRKRHLAQLVRVLPKPEQLFAIQSQRLDRAAERIGLGLSRNLQIHRARLVKAEALLRPRPIAVRTINPCWTGALRWCVAEMGRSAAALATSGRARGSTWFSPMAKSLPMRKAARRAAKKPGPIRAVYSKVSR